MILTIGSAAAPGVIVTPLTKVDPVTGVAGRPINGAELDHDFRQLVAAIGGTTAAINGKADLSGGLVPKTQLPNAFWLDRPGFVMGGVGCDENWGGFVWPRVGVVADLALCDSDGIAIVTIKSPAKALKPFGDNTISLGLADARYKDIWAVNTIVNGSDARDKTSVVDCPLGLDFVRALRPVLYKWTVGERKVVGKDDAGAPITEDMPGKRPHGGFVAQEVRDALDALGVEDFAGYCYDAAADKHMLRYTEFVAPLAQAIKDLDAENQALRSRSEQLEARLAALEQAA